MKILVLGAGGMAGHLITVFLSENGNFVTGFSRRQLSFCETVVGDATDSALIKRLLVTQNYDAVINCIGVLNQAVDASPVIGIYLNSVFPHLLAQYTKNTDTRIVHLSTDCVFSGKGNGWYCEKDFCDADTLYGRSKALGELNDVKNLTIRTSIVGCDIAFEKVGLFNWFMRQNDAVQGYKTVLWNGITTLELAKAVETFLEQNVAGRLHLASQQKISKMELLTLFNKIRNKPLEIFENTDKQEDKSLRSTRKDISYVVPTYEHMIDSLQTWMSAHASLYPHYEVKGL